MPGILCTIKSLFKVWLLNLKRNSVYLLDSSIVERVGYLECTNYDKYVFHVIVERVRYHKVYRSWFIPDKIYVFYRARSAFDGEPDDLLLKAGEFTVSLPQMKYLLPEDEQSRLVAEAYVKVFNTRAEALISGT